MTQVNPDYLSPCGLYCGVCAILMAHRDNNRKFKERLLALYQGGVAGKGKLPGSSSLTLDDMQCEGCLSQNPFVYCRQCDIKDCVREKGLEGCHECSDFPCTLIETFPMTVGKRVIMRAVPYRRQVGAERWARDEEARYVCPECGHKLFRGAVRCNQCKTTVDLD